MRSPIHLPLISRASPADLPLLSLCRRLSSRASGTARRRHSRPPSSMRSSTRHSCPRQEPRATSRRAGAPRPTRRAPAQTSNNVRRWRTNHRGTGTGAGAGAGAGRTAGRTGDQARQPHGGALPRARPRRPARGTPSADLNYSIHVIVFLRFRSQNNDQKQNGNDQCGLTT